MDTQTFADLVRKYVVNETIDVTLKSLRRPPGRRISPEERARSEWFKLRSTEEAKFLKQVMQEVAEASIFHLFAVLDRAKKLTDEGHFELYFVDADRRILLNDFNGIGLHEAFNAE